MKIKKTDRAGLTLLLLPVFLGATLLFVPGCDKGAGVNIPTGPAPTVDNLIEAGWALFEAADYDSADAIFTQAIERDASTAGAYLGRGWTRTRLGGFNSAILSYNLVLVLASGTAMATDSKVGLALANSAIDEDSLAIVWGKQVLSDAPDYQFEHDSGMTAATVRLLMAQAHFSLGEYYLAHLLVEQLNPQFRSSLTTQQGTTTSLRVEESSSGRPVVVDSVDTEENTNNLVVVLSVAEVGGSGSFNAAAATKRWTDLDPRSARVRNGWEVTVELAPHESLIPGTTEVAVTYLHVPDYSRYLAGLMAAIQSLGTGD